MLRRAFEATVNDPAFREEAQKLGMEITRGPASSSRR